MTTAFDEFLAQKRIAVAGVSSTHDDAANLIYRKLRETGHEVFAINPKVQQVEGDPCYPALQAIPGGVDGVVIVTRPEVADQIVHDCADLGIKRVWMHRSLLSMLGGSVSEKAVEFCQQHDIQVIAGSCPMMFCEPVDFGHKCMRWIMDVTGKLPQV